MNDEQHDGQPASPSPDLEVIWRLFRDQKERCSGCGVRLKWGERDVRGRDGAWQLAEPREEVFTCLCYRCVDHVGPKTRFYLKAE